MNLSSLSASSLSCEEKKRKKTKTIKTNSLSVYFYKLMGFLAGYITL
jgi:hypothetical protein